MRLDGSGRTSLLSLAKNRNRTSPTSVLQRDRRLMHSDGWRLTIFTLMSLYPTTTTTTKTRMTV